MEVVASLSQGRTASARCGLFTHKSVPVIFETPFTIQKNIRVSVLCFKKRLGFEISFRIVIHSGGLCKLLLEFNWVGFSFKFKLP